MARQLQRTIHPRKARANLNPNKIMAKILTRKPIPELRFEIVETQRADNWEHTLKAYLDEGRNVMLPEFLFADLDKLEEAASVAGYEVGFLPTSKFMAIGKAYMIPRSGN